MIDYKKTSLANQVFEAIEKSILTGYYKKGEVLSESTLSEELGVSRTPVREAILRLENEMLVATTPSGTIVLGITDEDVEDMFLVKKSLEPLAFKRAATFITDEALEKLKNIIEQQEFYASKGDVEVLQNLDTEFHDLIYAYSKSPVLYSILSPNHHKLLKFRRASLEKRGRIMHSVEEHFALFNALSARDGDKAEALMREHIDHSYNNLKED